MAPLSSKAASTGSPPIPTGFTTTAAHTEPFPFGGDLERLRRLALVARRAWREIVRDGRFLAAAERRWPATAHRIASEWLERKRRLGHHIDRLRDQLRL